MASCEPTYSEECEDPWTDLGRVEVDEGRAERKAGKEEGGWVDAYEDLHTNVPNQLLYSQSKRDCLLSTFIVVPPDQFLNTNKTV